MATGYFTHPACRLHDMGPGHPECPQRLTAIDDHLRAQGLDAILIPSDCPVATLEQLGHAHDHNYVIGTLDTLQRIHDNGSQRHLDPDTVAMPGTREAALRAAGGAVVRPARGDEPAQGAGAALSRRAVLRPAPRHHEPQA